MQPIPYSALDKKQREQVTYLFSDSAFGTNAKSYMYEINEKGDVIGRVGTKKVSMSKKRALRPHVNIVVMPAPHVTDELIQRARMNMDALAVSIAQKIYQKQ